MQNKSSKLIFIVLVIAIIASGALFISSKTQKFGSFNAPTLLKSATNSNVSVSTTTTPVLSANTARQYILFTNDSANTIYLSLSGTATSSKGIRLNANGGTYEINQDHLYIGAISAVAQTATSTLMYVEQ